MDELLTAAKGLAEQELRRANAKFPQFHSLHEGWAVIWEEYKEAKAEWKNIRTLVKKYLWDCVMYNNYSRAKEFAARLREGACSLAAEAIQIEAMAMKMIDYIDRRADD